MANQTFTILTCDGKKSLVDGKDNYEARDKASNSGEHVAHCVPGDCRSRYEFNNYTGSWQAASPR